MKIRHLQKVDAATVVDDNNKPSEEKVETDALFSLLKKTSAPQDDSEEEADNQASVVLGKWTKTALDEEATTTQLRAPKRSIRKAAPAATYTATATTATKEKEPLESHNRQKHLVKLGSDGSVLDGSNQEITRLNFGVQHDNNVSIIIADFSALSWANNGVIELYTPVISFCSKDTPETVISYVMNTSWQWPNDKSAEFYIPQEVTSITNGMFLFSLQEKKDTGGNNVHTAPEIWVSKTVSFYTAPNIFNNSMLTPNEPNLNINSLAYLSKNRIGIEDVKSVNLGYDFSFGKFPIILGEKFDQYVKLIKLAADLMWNYECSKGFLLLKPTTAAITDQPTVCRFQAIKDKTDPSKNNYYCMLPKEITENAQSYTIAVAIADDDFERIYWSSNQTATVINNFLSNLSQLTNNLKGGFNTSVGSGLITADNYILISSDNFIIDTIENHQ